MCIVLVLILNKVQFKFFTVTKVKSFQYKSDNNKQNSVPNTKKKNKFLWYYLCMNRIVTVAVEFRQNYLALFIVGQLVEVFLCFRHVSHIKNIIKKNNRKNLPTHHDVIYKNKINNCEIE